MTNGILISIGNCGGLLSSNLYLAKEAPRYTTSLVANIVFQGVGIAIALSYTQWMRWENRRRDRAQGVIDIANVSGRAGATGTRDPNFRFQA